MSATCVPSFVPVLLGKRPLRAAPHHRVEQLRRDPAPQERALIPAPSGALRGFPTGFLSGVGPAAAQGLHAVPDAIGVEFVAASGRTKALVTLQLEDLREAGNDDLVTVRPRMRQ
jgi:hypothetical protein